MIRMVGGPKYSIITPVPRMSSIIGDMKASPWKHRDATHRKPPQDPCLNAHRAATIPKEYFDPPPLPQKRGTQVRGGSKLKKDHRGITVGPKMMIL